MQNFKKLASEINTLLQCEKSLFFTKLGEGWLYTAEIFLIVILTLH